MLTEFNIFYFILWKHSRWGLEWNWCGECCCYPKKKIKVQLSGNHAEWDAPSPPPNENFGTKYSFHIEKFSAKKCHFFGFFS